MSDTQATFGARAAMPFDGFLEQTLKVNLDTLIGGLDGNGGVARDLALEREQIARLAARLLDPEFRPLLEWLCDITLRRPLVLPGLNHEGLIYAARREGGNAVVWQLLQAIAQGRGEKMPPREGV